MYLIRGKFPKAKHKNCQKLVETYPNRPGANSPPLKIVKTFCESGGVHENENAPLEKISPHCHETQGCGSWMKLSIVLLYFRKKCFPLF